MWERGREELKHLGISRDNWWRGWIHRIGLGNAVAYDQAILGWDEESPGVVTTSFQASKDWNGRQVTKEMRRTIPLLMKGRGVYLFNTYSLCVDPESPKWFRLLGMTEDEGFQGFQRGPYKLRRFYRRA
jgi:hypothetical protein